MDFSFTEEQTLLRNSVQKFVQNDYTFDNRRAIVKSDTGWSHKNWMKFAAEVLVPAALVRVMSTWKSPAAPDGGVPLRIPAL